MTNKFNKPYVAVDTVIFTVFDDALHVLIAKRDIDPFKNSWSLIGGYVNVEEDPDLEATAIRKLKEKTGVTAPYLEQFKTVGSAKRDPRGWTVTTVYFALISSDKLALEANKGASDVKWSKITGFKLKEKLAFDHEKILAGCIERLRSKVLYTSLPIYLLPPEFTLSELQKIYELILNHKIDHKSFRRRMLNADIINETNKMRESGRRPAKLYKLKKNSKPHYFVRNLEGSA